MLHPDSDAAVRVHTSDGGVLNRDQSFEIPQAREVQPFDRTEDKQISRPRRKIEMMEMDAKGPQCIQTLRGSGYVIVSDLNLL